MGTRRVHDAATVRRLAVAAEVDPRTIRKLLDGEVVVGMPGQRARRVLEGEGLLPPAPPVAAGGAVEPEAPTAAAYAPPARPTSRGAW
jgi:hypothetical protein